jgi:hypothetical protein
MATKVSGGSKAVKAATTATGSNGAATATIKVKPMPAKVVRNLAALGEPHRLAVLGFVAAAAGPVTLGEIEELLFDVGDLASAVNWLKQRGWLTSERVPKGSGGGWSYRLSDAGRERLLVLGG